ncbi:hypothetical protein [Streptosporangium sp. NPDC006007]|uniref:hypothetical protein n=1 Tax=Streptosporangium sp. NPDC006007 TaxID=3154575 RepID=UPI0033B54B85
MKRSRIGDLPMRVIYRLLAGFTAAVLAVVGIVVGLVYAGSSGQLGEMPARQVAAPSAVAPSPGLGSPPAASPTASASPTPTVSPSPAAVHDRKVVLAALADPRIPKLPRDRRLGPLPGKKYKTKRRLRDAKSGVSLIRFGRPWKIFGASPFSTKQVLPKAKGAGVRAMLVTCPVPIQAQKSLKDTALLAARWTLNHHPKGSKIAWTASQSIKDGWLLAYRVKYRVKGKSRLSMAAVAVTEVPGTRPAMIFVTIPDAQHKRWRDINTAISSIRLK